MPDSSRTSSLNVWLNPAHGESVSELAEQLRPLVHLIVVPKTGSRRADIAVLSDPEPAELQVIARVLPGTPLLAATSAPPTAELLTAAQRVGAHVLTRATADQLLSEIRLMCPQ